MAGDFFTGLASGIGGLLGGGNRLNLGLATSSDIYTTDQTTTVYSTYYGNAVADRPKCYAVVDKHKKETAVEWLDRRVAEMRVAL